MANLIKNMEFRIGDDIYFKKYKRLVLSWRGFVLGAASFYVKDGVGFFYFFRVESYAKYFSLTYRGIKEMINKFVLDGGLGEDVYEIKWDKYE